MYKTYLQDKIEKGKINGADNFLLKKSSKYLEGLLIKLDEQIDSRLVRTFYNVFISILILRNKSSGLLLSELGGYICGFRKAPAGTKRISNLLRSKKWEHKLIKDYLFEKTKERIASLQKEGKRPLLLWDDSRLEKPESWWSEGLCSVWSSKGKRLTKIKRGFYRPPSSRICVPGYKWTATMLSCLGGVPSVCQMTWWTTRGKHKELATNIIFRMLKRLKKELNTGVLHVLDRGYANIWTVEHMLHFQQDFLIRWKKNHLLISTKKGKKKTHLLARSFKGKKPRLIYDKERKEQRSATIAWGEVFHPELPDIPLYLVILRDKKRQTPPIYFLTSVIITNARTAWEMANNYMHRWEIEQSFRFCKTELAMESPRLWFWENKLKLLAIVALVYDFLLTLLRNWRTWVNLFLRNWGHRTGNRYRNTSIPIYRLRAAISVCIFSLFALLQNSG